MKKPLILIVDDEPFNVDYLEQELEELACDTAVATNGREALAQVTAVSPDLVLLDIMMPVMDGFETLSCLKANVNTRHIPVIIISAQDDINSVIRGIEMGAEDYLGKPFNTALLASRIHNGLEKKRLRDQEQLYLKGLERELEIGRQIQAGFLPRALPQPPGWEIAAYFKAAREVAGDFYDAFTLPHSNRIGLIVGDVSDKGVGAALYMTLFRSLLRVSIHTDYFDSPLEDADRLQVSLSLTNNYIADMHGDTGMFATIFFGLLDPATGSLLYINAGHEPAFIIDANCVKQKLESGSPLVGVIPGADFVVAEAQLQMGDQLLIYSDGLTDAENEQNQFFSRQKLLSLLGDGSKTAVSLLNLINTSLQAHVGKAKQFDDITILAVHCHSHSN